jgi:hypothetical protein
MNESFQRGDIVQLVFPDEPIFPYRYKVSAVYPDNGLSVDRVDICDENDDKSFNSKRGIGMPVKYLQKII